jgi:dienelactone hydrolase
MGAVFGREITVTSCWRERAAIGAAGGQAEICPPYGSRRRTPAQRMPAARRSEMAERMIGPYSAFAAEQILGEGPAELSFRQPRFHNLADWRDQARAKALELVAQPDTGESPKPEVVKRTVVEGVEVELLRWQLSFGPPTEAVFLKPQGAKGPLPGIVALHDHGGLKYFGWRKIADDGRPVHPILQEHRKEGYGGKAWANELAKRGYAVLVPDCFPFASRRILVSQVAEHLRWAEARDVTEAEEEADIIAYNQWAAQHESIVSKVLFAAGTTWPGIFSFDDRRAVDVLCGRPEVDPERLGCGGLSGGGCRTLFLGGLDLRIKCAICVGMMTTWRDLILQKCGNHTWMMWAPGMPKYLDYPEILGLRVPLPTMVLNNNEDSLFTLSEMHRADDILREVYEKAGAPERYGCRFYPGPHKFDGQMQEDAFAWFDRWLKRG